MTLPNQFKVPPLSLNAGTANDLTMLLIVKKSLMKKASSKIDEPSENALTDVDLNIRQ